MKTHVEHDSLGEVQVPQDVYYGAQTERARQNFPVSQRRLPTELIHALGLVKAAAARANVGLGLLPATLGEAIAEAADAVAAGRCDEQFVVDVFQTGSGTSSNMNANEVVAKLANERLTGQRHPNQPAHPNDHVNLGQSSNDVFPTAVHLAAMMQLEHRLVPALAQLQQSLAIKALEFQEVLKIGRTHLQDATPITLGQEFASYARMIERSRQRLTEMRGLLGEVALGGTAVGSGLNTHPKFARRALEELHQRTGLELRPAVNSFEALGSRHALVAVSGALKTLAADLLKIANDLRLLSSGPRCGLGEIALPPLQPGSSMMPGKVNPVLEEVVCQVAAQVIGNDAAITIGGQSGLLELNVMMPMMADNLLSSQRLLTHTLTLWAERSISGITARPERCRQWIEQSLALATALVPQLGYDRAAQLAQRAAAEGRTIREIAQRDAGLAAEELRHVLDPHRLSHQFPAAG